jgi:hypothetical protein
MGIAESMNANMRKNMEMQMQFQKELILKQRQLQLATQIALGRERLWYYQTFVILAAIGLTGVAVAKRDVRAVFPLVPLGFAYAFQYDMLYGNMMERAQAEADKLIVENPLKFVLPAHSGIVSLEDYFSIMSIKEGKKVIRG